MFESPESAASTVVLGVGNPLMGDDGLGLVALERLRRGWTFSPHVELVDGGTWGMNLLPTIESASHLLVVDAIHRDLPPGASVRMEREDLPRMLSSVLSPHQIDLKEVFALAEIRGTFPPEAVALGLQPHVVAMGTELSEAVAARMDSLLAAIIEQLTEWGHVNQRIAGEASARAPEAAWTVPRHVPPPPAKRA